MEKQLKTGLVLVFLFLAVYTLVFGAYYNNIGGDAKRLAAGRLGDYHE